jgi:argininosuccinate lyase
MKLWQKNTQVETSVEKFTVGQDRELDLQLAAFDVLGSLAHTKMLKEIGLLEESELVLVENGLKEIYKEIEAG